MGSASVRLSYGGMSVAEGQFGAWTPIGAEQNGPGYQVVWKNTVTNQYVTWSVDGGGNFLSQTGLQSGTSFAFESLEASFSQDLNGDGTIGLTSASIESAGSTTLTQVADAYFINYGSTPVRLSYGGMFVVQASSATGLRSALSGWETSTRLRGGMAPPT